MAFATRSVIAASPWARSARHVIAAVDVDRLAGDGAALVRGEEQAELAHFLARRVLSQRDRRQRLRRHLLIAPPLLAGDTLPVVLRQLGFDARDDTVAADPHRPDLARDGDRQRAQRR